MGLRIASGELKKTTFQVPLPERYTALAVQSVLTVYQAIQKEISQLEHLAFNAVKLSNDYKILQTTTEIGKILGLTIMLETGDIDRFASPGNYTSYCRCVDSKRASNGKTKGSGNAKAGNKYLSWAFAEAAHFGNNGVRFILKI